MSVDAYLYRIRFYPKTIQNPRVFQRLSFFKIYTMISLISKIFKIIFQFPWGSYA
jgi:hypothetical protein